MGSDFLDKAYEKLMKKDPRDWSIDKHWSSFVISHYMKTPVGSFTFYQTYVRIGLRNYLATLHKHFQTDTETWSSDRYSLTLSGRGKDILMDDNRAQRLFEHVDAGLFEDDDKRIAEMGRCIAEC